MDGARSHARSRVQAMVSAWIAGDYDTVAAGCTADVRWWTPLSGKTVSGRSDVREALQRVIAPLHRPIDVTAVVVNDEGTRCVVELTSAVFAPDNTRPAFVTSVIAMREGQISAGRTYADMEASERPAVEGT